MTFTKTSKNPVIIGLLYADYCRYCHELVPIWNEMYTNIENKSYNPRPKYKIIEKSNLGELEKFNDKNSKLLKGERVKYDGFPTLFKINNGKIEYYTGSREPVLMEKWFMLGV